MPDKDYEVGDASAARLWIESSSLPGATKQAILLLVERFSKLTFYRENATFLND